MKRSLSFLLSIFSLLSVTLPVRAQVFPKEDLSPYYRAINNIYANRRVNRLFSREVFRFSTEIRPMKEFFIKNASRQLRPKPLSCINTLRAGLETLFFGQSNIPFSAGEQSEHGLFRHTGANRIIDLVRALSDSGCINDYKDIYFIGRTRRGDTVIINENNFADSLRILTISGSVWHAILSMIPQVRGWSVFCLSLNNGYHSVTLAVNHTNPHSIKMYWADQTRHHPVLLEDRLNPGPEGEQFGWERMTEFETSKSRSLDDYCLYAVSQFMDSHSEDAGGEPVNRRNMPIIRIWKISKP